MSKSKLGRGKRLTVRAKLLPYVQEVMKAFGLEDESSAVNLIIGSCSVKPISWLAMRPGETSVPLPPTAIEVSSQKVEEFGSELSVIDLLAENIQSLQRAT